MAPTHADECVHCGTHSSVSFRPSLDDSEINWILGISCVVLGLGIFAATHYLSRPYIWLAPAMLVVSVVTALLLTSSNPRVRRRLTVARTLLFLAAIGLMLVNGVHVFNAEAPARAAAAAAQAVHDRQISEVRAQLGGADGTTSREGDRFDIRTWDSSDDITVDPTGTSGTISVATSVGRSTQFQVLEISKVDGRWVAGCPSPGGMVPLSADHNRLAIVLVTSGHCPNLGP
jgi:hypothetical protein